MGDPVFQRSGAAPVPALSPPQQGNYAQGKSPGIIRDP